MELIAELMRITVDLNEHGIDYAICGGVAMAIHGHARPSRDIDLMIRKDDLALCKCLLRKLGYSLEMGIITEADNQQNHREVYRISKAELDQLLSVNFELLSPELQPVWKTRTPMKWKGISAPVITLAGLRQMAEMAGETEALEVIQSLEKN